MSDRANADARSTIQDMLGKFLEDESLLRPAEKKTPPAMTEPGPVTLNPLAKN